MGINTYQLKTHIIEPVLREIGLYSEAAVNLLLGTAATESDMASYIVQTKGPALGIYQMEPTTHDDIWNNYVTYRSDLEIKLKSMHNDVSGYASGANALIGNLYYATAMCRIHYLRVPEKLPDADDIHALASYWKDWYNTSKGKGKVEDFVEKYNKYVR